MVTTNNVATNYNYGNFVKLSKNNFHEWKIKIVANMSARSLGSFLSDHIPPTDPAERAIYEVNNSKVLSAFHETIDFEHFQVICRESNALSAYKALCAHHDDAGGIGTATIFCDLMTLKLQSSCDVSTHVAQFRALHNNLLGNTANNEDLKICDTFIAIILLKSLPSEYASLVQTCLSALDTFNLARIYSLLSMESKISPDSSTSQNEIALAAKSNPINKPKFDKSELKCSLGHVGHTNAKCRKKKETEEKEMMMKKIEALEAKLTSSNVKALHTSADTEQAHPSY